MFTTQDFRRAHPGGRRPVRSRFYFEDGAIAGTIPARNTLIAKLNPAPNSDWMQQVLDLKLSAKPFGSRRLTRCDSCHSSGRIAGEGTNGNEP
jgi:hypothetical protein